MKLDTRCPLCKGDQIHVSNNNWYLCPKCEPITLIHFCNNSIEFYLTTAEKIMKQKQASIIASVLNHKKLT